MLNRAHHFEQEAIPVQAARVDDINIAYRDFGNGDPLLLINGFGSTMDMWNPPVLAAFQRDFRVITFDARGMGYSGSSEKRYSIPQFMEDSAGLLDVLGISRCHVLGFSLGGMVAQELALNFPERIKSLVLLSTDCGGSNAKRMSRQVWDTVTDKRGSPAEQAERMFSVIFPPAWTRDHDPWDYCPEIHETTPADNIARQAETLSNWAGTCHRLSEIRCSALIVTGTDDVIIPPENSFMLVKRIPAAWLVRFRNGGHGLAYQFPEEFSRIVTTFLELSARMP